jgi:predicted PurR-regulated permease PerM
MTKEPEEERFSMKKFVTVMGAIIFAISLLFYFRSEFVDIAHEQIKQINATLKNTTQAVNINAQNTKVLATNQKVSFQNQKVIAKGLNDLGSVLISDVSDIKNSSKTSTDLIEAIKFNTEKILNQSITGVTRVPQVNITNESIDINQ